MKNILVIGNHQTYITKDNGIKRIFSNGDYQKLAAAIHSTTIHEVVFMCGYSYEDLSRESQQLIAQHSPIVEGDITLCNRYPNTELQVQEDIEYFKRKLDNPHITPRTREKVKAQIAVLEDALNVYKVKHIPKKIGVMDTVRIKGYEWGDFTVIAIDETRTGSVAWIKNNDNSYKSFSIDFLERV